MKIDKVKVIKCSLNLGELHRLKDFEHINPELLCETKSGEQFTVEMRLHISEQLDGLIFADPREFPDKGYSVNSVNSKVIARKKDYKTVLPENIILDSEVLRGTELYTVSSESIMKALIDGYDFEFERKKYLEERTHSNKIAFTCHDPNIIGGGNVILFRLINWLSKLGVEVTVYSCGTPPSWMKIDAKFKCYKRYKEMFESIEERIVVVYSMWHIEPILKSELSGKLVYHIRQIYEPFHYGTDYDSMISRKPAIELLETLKLGIITISPHLEDYYRRLHGLENILITNGIDPKVFYPFRKKDRNEKEVTIVSVGNSNHFVKGSSLLFKALKIFAERKKNLTIHWEILSGSKGDIDYPEIPSNLKIEQLVGLNQLQMRERYNKADLFVNPSLYEGFGLPPIEAMMCGTPVVQADNLGLDFIIEDKQDCLIVPVNDEKKTAEAIQKILEDKKLYTELAEGGFKKAMRYTVRHQFNSFVPAFENILDLEFDEALVERIRKSFGYEIDKDYSLANELKREKRFNPLVSVIIPSYNQAEYLREALDSLIVQTYSNWEAVVVNDGSKDHTEQVMNEYAQKDSRIRTFSKPNGGITSALNAGLEKAKGEFFCWLSSDDLFYPTKIELQVNAFEKLDESYALVYGSFDILQESSNTKELQRQPYASPLIEGCEFPEALKFDFIDGCTVMIRMEVMREVNGFNPGIVHSQDMELWVRLASRGYKFSLLPNKLTIRRVHVAQSSTLNMIHCRYDAAWMINFYLSNYSLVEIYRYTDFKSEKSIRNFIEHFTSRTFDTEANVNHPLLQEKYWNWFKEGIKTLPPNIQNILLRNCLLYFMKYIDTTYKVKYYVEQCIGELKKERIQIPVHYDYSPLGRDFRETDRSRDEFAIKLFEYGLNLLVNEHTPLFAQELYFHNTNKLVDTPYKLAHSAFRYLSQFNNPFRETVKPYIDFSFIPQTKSDALQLYCKLKFPEKSEELINSFIQKDNPVSDVYDERIAQYDSHFFDEIKRVCVDQTNIPIFYYWYSQFWASKNCFDEALKIGWNITRFDSNELSAKMFLKLSEWALQSSDYEKAYVATLAAYSINSGDDLVYQKKLKCKELFLKNNYILPKSYYHNSIRANNSKHDTTILSCKIKPMLNGKFIVDLECENNQKRKFSSKGILPYEKELRPIVLTNNETHEKTIVVPEQLFSFYSNGYDFFAAYESQIQDKFNTNKIPSVSFYAPYTSVINGGTIVILRMANWLKELGVDVSVCSTDVEPKWYELSCPFVRKENKTELFQSIASDIIIAYSVLDIPEILKLCKSNKRIYHIAQVVEDFHYHGYDYESCVQPKGIFELLHSLPVGRISVSQHISEYTQHRYNQKSYLITNGINLLSFAGRKKYILNDEINICTVGNTNRILKGIYDVIKAVEITVKNNPAKKINLIIVSNDKTDLQQQINFGDYNFNLILLNNLSQDEMVKVYQKSDIYINASWYEGFGLPSIEAMACGVPVIQADNMGLIGIAEDGNNCLLFKPADVKNLSEKLIQLINQPELYEKLSVNGQKTSAKLSLPNSFSEFVQAFEKILFTKFDEKKVQTIFTSLKEGDFYSKVKNAKSILRPKFSIIIPLDINSDFISDSLDSLIAQNYDNWEAWIVYNEEEISRKNSYVIYNYSKLDSRIQLKATRGEDLSGMLNYGLKYAIGEWISIMFPGTIYLNKRLSNQVNAIEFNIDKKIIYSEYYKKDKTKPGQYSLTPDINWLNSIPKEDFQLISLLNENIVNPSSVFFHSSLIKKTGGFNKNTGDAVFYQFLLKAHVKAESVFAFNSTCIVAEDVHKFSSSYKKAYQSIITQFLADVSFEQLYLKKDLSNMDEKWEAALATVYVLKNQKSLLNEAKCSKLLEQKLLNWISNKCNDEFYNQVEKLISCETESNPKIKRFFNYYKLDSIKQAKSTIQKKVELNEEKQKNKPKDEVLVSIVLVTYNQFNYTRECLESIRKNTNVKYELIFIDNASSDKTVLNLIQDEEIILIQNKSNIGFPAAANKGIKAAKGKYILLLNNDTVLTEGWLENMIKVVESDIRIGMVGPISNEVSGLQKDNNAKYNSIEEMHKYAEVVANKNKGEILNFPRLAFLCTLIKREVIEKIGGLDERFSPGNYEDDDFCLRAQLAGYQAVIAKDVFIHHYGSKSFKAEGVAKYAEQLKINENKFIGKWGTTPDDLWLRNKPIKEHSIVYPLDNNLVKQSVQRANIHIQDSEFEQALSELEKAYEHYNEFEKSHEIIALADLLNLLGNISLITREFDKAKNYFEEELSLVPDSSSACLGLGEVFSAREEYDNAKVMYEWSARNNPRNQSAINALEKVNIVLGYEPTHDSLQC